MAFPKNPDVGAQENYALNVNTLVYATGKETRSPVHPPIRRLPLTWSFIPADVKDEIKAILIASSGLNTFKWEYPGEGRESTWVTENFRISRLQGELYRINATIRETPLG